MAMSCCSHLATLTNLTVAYPNSTFYLATEKSYWSLQEAALTPTCVAKPTDAADVSAIVSTLGSHDCHFAIKSHGHAPAAGFANIDDGVTVDLTGLDSVSVNDNHSIASIGAGASWLDAYAFLDPLNRTVAGGRNGGVGVGGLTLGGGISYFSPQVGWTCDTVRNFEIVLSAGEIVNANATSHPDLFRALKGGGNNFGIVTRMDMATVAVGEILGGSTAYEMEYQQDVFRAFVDIADASQYDVHASIVMGLVFNTSSKVWALSSTPIYTEPVLQPPVYRELFAVPNVTSNVELRRLSAFANETAIPQLNALFYTSTYMPSTGLLDAIFDIANTTLRSVSDSSLWNFAFEPLPKVLVSHGAGENVLGTSPADGNGMILLVSAFWTNSALNAHIHAVADDMTTRFESAAKRMGGGREFVYANYADASQDPLGSYGYANEEFLQGVAARYDPSGVFQRLVPGGFKLRR